MINVLVKGVQRGFLMVHGVANATQTCYDIVYVRAQLEKWK